MTSQPKTPNNVPPPGTWDARLARRLVAPLVTVGFFRFRQQTALRFTQIVAGYVESGRANMPHEEAVRDLLLERSQVFDTADVTGAPWIEIDFPNDVARAGTEILPQLQPLVTASR